MQTDGAASYAAEKPLRTLSLTCYRVTFAACEPLDLPSYLGSTLRGAFGHAFRAVACPAPRGQQCPIPAQCPYHLIFETSPPPGSDALRTHEEIPRPFVIAPAQIEGPTQQQFRPGDEVRFDLTLIGRAHEFFPYFVVALREVNRIGRGRQAVELRRIEDVTPASFADAQSSDCPPEPGARERREAIHSAVPLCVYDAAENLVRPGNRVLTLEDCASAPMPRGTLTIDFITQTRLKHEGRFIRRPEFHILFRRLLGRLSSLSRFHCGAPLDVDFRGLIDQAASIRLIKDETRWTTWQRYSTRQDRRMEWEGIVGRAAYEGAPRASASVIPTEPGEASRACPERSRRKGSTRSDLIGVHAASVATEQDQAGPQAQLAPFWKILKFGEFTHVGHGATFGLGRYAIQR